MVFYGKESAPGKYKLYLRERIEKCEATAFLALNAENESIGFVLNYHSFSSVSLGKVIVLNDLYVAAEYRNQGIGQQLIERTFEFAKDWGAVRVDLGTAKTNTLAQGLYDKMGFVKDTEFYAYSFTLSHYQPDKRSG